MTALSFVWVHPYSQNSGCDTSVKIKMDNSCISVDFIPLNSLTCCFCMFGDSIGTFRQKSTVEISYNVIATD